MLPTILIIDDSIPQHKLVGVALEDEPVRLMSAYSGESGLRMAALLKPAVILLDVDMPEMNGFDVCRLLKINPETAGSAVIFLTASSSMDEKICGFGLDAADYITKPFDPAELCARVRVVLRNTHAYDLLPAWWDRSRSHTHRSLEDRNPDREKSDAATNVVD